MTKTTENETLIGALALALPKLEGAKKNAANPHFKSKYADLGSVIDALGPIIEHGLWFRQQTHDNEAGAMVETFYIHTSGDEKSAGTLFMPASKKDAQAFGSALTYCRRYGLQCAFGLATEDDDANAAVAGAKRIDAPKQEPQRKDEGVARISGSQLDQIKALVPLQKTKSVVDIMRGYQDAAKKRGAQVPKDFDELTAQQGDAIIKRLNEIIDQERINAANPQHDAKLNDEVPA